MKTVRIIAVLGLSVVLVSGIAASGRTAVFQIGARAMPVGPGPAATVEGRKRTAAGQARWLRVVPGLFR